MWRCAEQLPSAGQGFWPLGLRRTDQSPAPEPTTPTPTRQRFHSPPHQQRRCLVSAETKVAVASPSPSSPTPRPFDSLHLLPFPSPFPFPPLRLLGLAPHANPTVPTSPAGVPPAAVALSASCCPRSLHGGRRIVRLRSTIRR